MGSLQKSILDPTLSQLAGHIPSPGLSAPAAPLELSASSFWLRASKATRGAVGVLGFLAGACRPWGWVLALRGGRSLVGEPLIDL